MTDATSTTAQGVQSATAQGAAQVTADAAVNENAQAVEETFDKERALETIRKQRASEEALAKENKRLAKIVADREAKDKAVKDAELSEVDKLKNQIAERDAALKDLTEKQSQLLRRQAIEREAAQAKWGKGKRAFIKPDQAYLLADLTGVTQDGDKFVGLDAALEKLANENEHLLAQAKPTLPATNSTTVNSGTDADAKRKELLQRFPRLKI
ncbi:MAG: hypothetical protein V1899_03105 [Planctomycetota bacterium]